MIHPNNKISNLIINSKLILKNKPMTIFKYMTLFILTIATTSCIGDKKAIDVNDIGDTSFINASFKGNKINYKTGMSGCDKLTAGTIASLYNVSNDLIHIEDPTKSDLYKDPQPGCMLFIKQGENDFEWLRGSIHVQREIAKEEFMGEIAEAAGTGENWEEAWSLKKSISKSSVWLPNMGKAALWNERKSVLEIKFEGYTLIVKSLKNILNEAEKTKKRDHKKIAIAIARASGYID
jgi:hypothetical protein